MQSHMTGQFEEHFKNSNVTKNKSRKLQANNRCVRSQDFQLLTYFKMSVCLSRGLMCHCGAVQTCSLRNTVTCSNFFTWGPPDLFKEVHLGNRADVLRLKGLFVL